MQRVALAWHKTSSKQQGLLTQHQGGHYTLGPEGMETTQGTALIQARGRSRNGGYLASCLLLTGSGLLPTGIGNLIVALWSSVTLPIDCTGPVLTSEQLCWCWIPGFLGSARSTREVLSRCSESGSLNPMFNYLSHTNPGNYSHVPLLTARGEVQCIAGTLEDLQKLCFPPALCVPWSRVRQRHRDRAGDGRTSEARPKERHDMVLHISHEKVRLTF